MVDNPESEIVKHGYRKTTCYRNRSKPVQTVKHVCAGSCLKGSPHLSQKARLLDWRGRAVLRLLLPQQRSYLEVLVLVVLLEVSPFLFFLCFVLVFTVPLDMVSWVVDDDVEVFWANIAMPLRREAKRSDHDLFHKFVS
jgi:hypothetical protein